MNAESLARALDARRSGGVWFARCPAHNDGTPSLAITDGKAGVLVRCHGGCPQEAVIDALKRRGLWEGRDKSRSLAEPRQVLRPDRVENARDVENSERARQLWNSSAPAAGTLVEFYLRSRRITLPAPDTFRFNPALRHASGESWPAMVAMVQRADGQPVAVHRTWLARDGTGKAPVEPNKMMLGPTRGGAVRLAPATGSVMVGEGIETCLAAMQATGKPAWAALSTSGLRALDLPPELRTVIVLADGDDAGEAAAQYAAARWAIEGRSVSIARPPRGQDFADMLA